VVTINGLDGYALPVLVDRFEYARAGHNKQNHHYKWHIKKVKPTEQNMCQLVDTVVHAKVGEEF
jgi:hypothetical protein